MRSEFCEGIVNVVVVGLDGALKRKSKQGSQRAGTRQQSTNSSSLEGKGGGGSSEGEGEGEAEVEVEVEGAESCRRARATAGAKFSMIAEEEKVN